MNYYLSIILFEPQSRALISADALWENGFGVIFQELEGERAFDEVAKTLDLIESLRPLAVIPGHGKVFTQVAQSLVAARRRLDGFVRDPTKFQKLRLPWQHSKFRRSSPRRT